MVKLKNDARVDGAIAVLTRKQIERKIGRSIVSSKNYLGNKKQKSLSAKSTIKKSPRK